MIKTNTIPPELRAIPHWVNWRYATKDGKQTKVPKDPKTLNNAATNNPGTWGSFEQVLKNIDKTDGIGFVLDNSALTGIDLDHCIDEDGNIAPWADRIIKQVNSYTEKSPSGQGIRIFVYAKLPEGRRKKGNIEAYDKDRYMTVTGESWDVTNITAYDGTQLHALLFGEEEIQVTKESTKTIKHDVFDDDLLRRMFSAKNGDTVKKLWDGDISDYPSHSEADMALCSYLWFWTGGRSDVDRLFLLSGLYRQKWDEKHFGDGRTYGEEVLNRSCTGETYTGKLQLEILETEQAPLEPKGFPVCPFPFEVLPEPFKGLVTEYSKALHVKPELIAMCMLSIASGTIGNSLVLEVKKGWEIPPFLWTAIIGITGTGKSPAKKSMMMPVKERQGNEATEHKALTKEYEAALSAYKAAKEQGAPPEEPPPMKHFFTMNFTFESLIPMYQAYARGLIFYIDELAGLLKGLNQYKNGGNDREQLLSLFDAGPLKSDRKSGNSYTPNSGAAIIGGIQPGIIDQVFRESNYMNGMIYRFLPLIIDPFPSLFTEDCISEKAAATWKKFIDWTYDIPLETDSVSGRIHPNKLILDPVAKEEWRLFHDRYAGAEPFVSIKFRGYLPKLRTYCTKFMSVLHVMECYKYDALALTVSEETVKGAIGLADFFAGQALRLIHGATEGRNPYHALILRALDSLRDVVSGGKLSLNTIREKVNKFLPTEMQLEASGNKRLSNSLRDMGFTVTEGAQHYRHLLWEPEKIYSQNSSLSSLSPLNASHVVNKVNKKPA